MTIAQQVTGASVDGRYPGGKGLSGLWQWILNAIPPHVTYVEPFAGRAAIARRKTPALQTWLIDVDEAPVRWLRSLSYPGKIVIRGDGIQWLRHASERGLIDEETVVYCDPPYVLSTRVKQRIYAHEMTDSQHAALLDVLITLPCQVMISGYQCPLYASRLRHWWSDKRPCITRGGTLRDERLWCNFEVLWRCSTRSSVETIESANACSGRSAAGPKTIA